MRVYFFHLSVYTLYFHIFFCFNIFYQIYICLNIANLQMEIPHLYTLFSLNCAVLFGGIEFVNINVSFSFQHETVDPNVMLLM